jgi:hypothetical protein
MERLRDWLAFSIQKLAEIDVLRRGLEQGRDAIAQDLHESDAAQNARARSSERANSEVKRRLARLRRPPIGAATRSPCGVRHNAHGSRCRCSRRRRSARFRRPTRSAGARRVSRGRAVARRLRA